MKRLNPNTGKPFVHGDVRADGFIFWRYTNRIRKDGNFQEHWYSPAALAKVLKYNANYSRIKYVENKTAINANHRKYYKDNSHKLAKNAKIYRQNNAESIRANKAKRRAAKMQRTPAWLTKDYLSDIEDFYIIAQMFRMYTGEAYHVDHIVPLQGKKVSGLHVPWNLQVLHWKDNLAKNNKAP